MPRRRCGGAYQGVIPLPLGLIVTTASPAHSEARSKIRLRGHHAEGADMQQITPYRHKVTPLLATSGSRTCWGCGKPFVVRNGHAEAIVGPDNHLYCYRNGCDDDAFAQEFAPLKRAS